MCRILSVEIEKEPGNENTGSLFVKEGANYRRIPLLGAYMVTIELDYRPSFELLGPTDYWGLPRRKWDTVVVAQFEGEVYRQVVIYGNHLRIAQIDKNNPFRRASLQ